MTIIQKGKNPNYFSAQELQFVQHWTNSPTSVWLDTEQIICKGINITLFTPEAASDLTA